MKIKIEKLIFGGYGLGHDTNGQTIFVKKSVPGDELEIEIIKEKESFKEGIIKQIARPSLQRIDPPCPHFERCGGCEHQNIDYPNQLKFKEEIFIEVLRRADIQTEILPIIQGSNEEFFYRGTQRFFLGTDDANHLIYQMHDFAHNSQFVEIKSCLLQSKFCNQFLDAFKEFFDTNIEDKSTLWQIRIREGKRTGDFMVEIITKTKTLPEKNQFIMFIKQFPQIKSAYHCISADKNLRNAKRHLLVGSPIIYERIGKFTFQLSPESFFQTNSCGVKTLYDKIKELANIKIGSRVLDLFCGAGTIGIYLSTLAKDITGVELIQNAINDAKANARINHATNTNFIHADATTWLRDNKTEEFDTIVVDPPRSGLTKNIIFELGKLEFNNLVYISCDPATFARDIKELKKQKLILVKVQPIDMFPQTHHIECIGLITK